MPRSNNNGENMFSPFNIYVKKHMQELPIYKAIIYDEFDGITAISFVQYPAVESGFVQFAKQSKPLKFSVIDKQNKKVCAPIMRCDFPIYRIDENGNEYYLVYTKEVIETMARKMLSENSYIGMNKEHNPNNPMDGVYLEELFIKNVEKGINPIGFENIENYSLFGVYSINNESIWQSICDGEFNGISIEGFFTYEIEDKTAIWSEIYELLKECEKRNIK